MWERSFQLRAAASSRGWKIKTQHGQRRQWTVTQWQEKAMGWEVAHCVVVDNEHYRVVYIAYLKEHNFHFQSPCITSVIIYHPENRVNEFFTHFGGFAWYVYEIYLLFVAMDEFLMMPLCYQKGAHTQREGINLFGGTCGVNLVTVKERHKFSLPLNYHQLPEVIYWTLIFRQPSLMNDFNLLLSIFAFINYF